MALVLKKKTKVRSGQDPLVVGRVEAALAEVNVRELTGGNKGKRFTVRVDERLFATAAEKSGIADATSLVTAALALLAAPDNIGAKLMSRAGQMSDDFELAL